MAAAVLSCMAISAKAENPGFVFLRHGFGARPAALGEAVTACGGDLSVSGYNPGSLMSLRSRTQLAFAYNRIYDDVSQGFLSAGFRSSKFAGAFFINAGKVGGIERRSETASPYPLGEFEENNYMLAAYFAGDAGIFDAGLALKYAYEKIDYSSAGAAMFDFGFNYDAGYGLRVGGAVRNIGKRYRFEQISYRLPLEYRFGAAYSILKHSNEFNVMADIVLPRNSNAKLNLGTEWLMRENFALRAGYGFGYDSRSISLGGGLGYGMFIFDYAFTANSNDLGGSHRFTVTFAP